MTRFVLAILLAVATLPTPAVARSVTWRVHRQGRDAIWSTYAGGPKCSYPGAARRPR